jgi:nitroreductase
MSADAINDFRHPEHDLNPLILNRWSPRALSGEAISDEELMSLLEAAKWAPSAFNNQPWRFIYVKNGTPAWDKMFSTLAAPNQSWVKKAAVLVLILSRRNFSYNNQANRTASFDAGAAWENLALEARSRNLVAHAMSGFDYEAARVNFQIAEDYNIEAMVALGCLGKKEDLPEKMQAVEFPSDRQPLSEITAEGEFKFK